MRLKAETIGLLLITIRLTTVSICNVYAQESKPGELKISVTPPQAYTFVDDQAMGPGHRSIRLAPGKHTVIVANYGYDLFRQDISIESAHTTSLETKLQPAGGDVSGPRGRIQIELGTLVAGDYAVLLNGKKPDYFVGHVDEINHDIWWKQELIVPPGSHQVTVTRYDRVVWSGTIPVAANQRVIVSINNGKQRTKEWPRGSQLGTMHRFVAKTASASIVIAPVTATITANPPRVDCNQPSELKWESAETIDGEISGMSPVPTRGVAKISPRQTTEYDFKATGPGGVAGASTTVEVNPVIVASLEASPAQLTYQRIGDKVLKQDSTTLNWSTSNADTIALDPFGPVDRSGSRTVQIAPAQNADGPIDQTINYTLHATNVCGGSEAKTIAVHLTGSAEPIPTIPLKSVFFPTDYPGEGDTTVGLLQSQKETLATLADGFIRYLRYDPDAKLSIAAYSDERGTKEHNQPLSERRGEAVKNFLVASGVPSEKIDVSAHGDDQPLDENTVADLQASNPNQPSEPQAKEKRTSWLAYNRRVDITVLPQNQQSSRYYPNNAPDLNLLWQEPKPEVTAIEQDH